MSERGQLRRIALVTPYQWSTPSPVNEQIAELACSYVDAQRGDSRVPDVVIIAPSLDPIARRTTRRALRDLAHGRSPEEVLGAEDVHASEPGVRRSSTRMSVPLLALGVPLGATASVAHRSSLRLVMDRGGIDAIHVFDPLESDLVRFVVRHWSGLTIASMTALPDSAAALTAPLRERVIDQVDLWVASAGDIGHARRISEFAGIDVGAIMSLPTIIGDSGVDQRSVSSGTIVLGRGDDDEAQVRQTITSIAAAEDVLGEQTFTLLSRWEPSRRPRVPAAIRTRVSSVNGRSRAAAREVLAQARAYVSFPGTDPRAIDEARAAGLQVFEFPIDDRLHELVQPSVQPAATCPSVAASSGDLVTPHLAAVESLLARRQVHIAVPSLVERTCAIDMHMHTSHSWDCATDPEALLYVARKVGLTAIAVTDHNEISGGVACAELADEYGVQVIVGEEVKTAEGEVIGLFLTERIEPGLSWNETIALIRAQDGIVYVPHPFDRLHTIPDARTLRESLDEIDAFETYNARLAFDQYNRDAQRFAHKYNLVEGAGSDAHVVQGLGTAAVHMPAWDDPESFLTALRQGEIVRRPRSLFYLQGLKWINDVTGRSRQTPVGRDTSG